MKLLLFSDLHLDAHFAWAKPVVARARRRLLRDALDTIIERARALDVDALLCAGDLYEHDRYSPDTVQFVRGAFERLHPTPVFVAPGNHDWYGPESLYRRCAFSPNVHVFDADRLTPVELDAGVTLWGAAHRVPANTDGFLDDFRVDRSGINLALFHGSERGAFAAQESGKAPHAPFTPDQIERAGLDHALLGHYHAPCDADRHTYPGNPCPLSFGESGERGIVVFDVSPGGEIIRRRERVTTAALHDVEVDLTGCASSWDVRETVFDAVRGRDGCVRVTLTGALASDVEVRPSELTAPDWLDDMVVRTGAGLRVAYDFDAIAGEPTVRGRFVKDVLDSDLDEDESRAILITGLRALEGRDDLEVV